MNLEVTEKVASSSATTSHQQDRTTHDQAPYRLHAGSTQAPGYDESGRSRIDHEAWTEATPQPVERELRAPQPVTGYTVGLRWYDSSGRPI